MYGICFLSLSTLNCWLLSEVLQLTKDPILYNIPALMQPQNKGIDRILLSRDLPHCPCTAGCSVTPVAMPVSVLESRIGLGSKED